MKTKFYFQHDEVASLDEKIIDLRADLGWEGYGLFWALIEWLHREGGHLEYKPKRMAVYLNTTPEVIEALCRDFDLFDITDDMISSKRLCRQLEYREALSKKRRTAGKKGAEARKSSAHAEQLLPDTPALATGKKRERKEKKKFTPPLESEVIDYFLENGFRADVAKRAFQYYEANDWKDGTGKQVRAWKQKMVGVWFKDEHRPTANTQNVIEMAKQDYHGLS